MVTICLVDCSNDRECGAGKKCLAPLQISALLTTHLLSPGDICRLPPEKGPCEARIPRFFYNPASRTCQRFYYGGCQGNRNNFRTFRACQRACRNLVRGPSA
uniref:BPTI/Kunitz inhibitor domain-containing protein n=1 Tax=Chelydra serpentina TaxID=8475 RepID=A0A8C3SF81_CHESE